MALTKDEIKTRLLPRQLVKRRASIVWGDIVSSVASANATQKAAIADKLRVKDYISVGRILSEIVMAALVVQVQQDLDQKLANNSLNIDELSEILE
jgi:hypothetical protein